MRQEKRNEEFPFKSTESLTFVIFHPFDLESAWSAVCAKYVGTGPTSLLDQPPLEDDQWSLTKECRLVHCIAPCPENSVCLRGKFIVHNASTLK